MTKKTSAKFLVTKDCSLTVGTYSRLCVKGEEVDLPEKTFNVALRTGAFTPIEDLDVVDKAAGPEGDTRTLDDKLEILVEVCEQLIAGGDSKKFTQLLKPKVPVVREMVDFDFTKQTMLRAYDEALFRSQQTKDSEEEENDGSGTDDSDETVGSDTQ